MSVFKSFRFIFLQGMTVVTEITSFVVIIFCDIKHEMYHGSVLLQY